MIIMEYIKNYINYNLKVILNSAIILEAGAVNTDTLEATEVNADRLKGKNIET